MAKHILKRFGFLVVILLLTVLCCRAFITDDLAAVIMAMFCSVIVIFLAAIFLLIESYLLNKSGEKQKRNVNIIVSICFLSIVLWFASHYIFGV